MVLTISSHHFPIHLPTDLSIRSNTSFSLRYELNCFIECSLILVFKAVSRLWRSVAGLSPRRPWFDRRSVRVRFVVDKVALNRFFSEYFCFPFSVSFPAIHHYYLHQHIAVTRRIKGRRLWNSPPPKKQRSFENRGEHWIGKTRFLPLALCTVGKYFFLQILRLNACGD